jgi:hypothetical protein
MVAIFPTIGQPFLETSSQVLATTALGLGKSFFARFEFAGMRDLLAGRQREEMVEARIKTDLGVSHGGNRLGGRIDEEAQIPARRTFDDPSAFESPWGDILGVKAYMSYAWHMDRCAIWCPERIGKGDARQLVTLAFELRLLGQSSVAALPGRVRGVKHALQGMTGDAQLFAMVRKQIVERFARVVDVTFGILFELAYRPIPGAREVEEPEIQLRFLGRVEA